MNGVSVVIPCLNEETYLAQCLDGLLDNGYPVHLLDIMVVDGGSQDATLDILRNFSVKYPCVRLIHNEKQKTPFALNLGIKHAKYDYVLIAGAHAKYPIDYISSLEKLIQQDNIDVVGGSIETKTKTINRKTQAINFVLSHTFGVGNSVFRTGADCLMEVDTVPFGLYKKEIFEKVGLYNEKLIRNHDMELSSRIKQAGYCIWLSPELSCVYYARETFQALAKNNYGNGLWNIKTLWITKKFNSLGLRHYIPLIFILSLFIPLLLGIVFSTYFIMPAMFSLLTYFSAILFFSFKAHDHSKLNVVMTFMVLHFSYGVGSLIGFLSILRKGNA